MSRVGWPRRGGAGRVARLVALGLEPAGIDAWAGRLAGGDWQIYQHGLDWSFSVRVLGAPDDLSVGSEAEIGRLRRFVEGEDIQIGDPEFDAVVRIRGPELAARAMCRADVREVLRRWVGPLELRLARGVLSWVSRGHGERRAVERVNVGVGLLGALQLKPAQYPLRLLRNASQDPVAGVRAVSLRTLLEGPVGALSPPRRWRAGLLGLKAGDPGLERLGLEALAGALAAVPARIERLPEGLLVALLKVGDDTHRLRVVARLGEVGGPGCLPALEAAGRGLLDWHLRSATRAAAAQVLERLGGGGAGALSLASEGQAGGLAALAGGLEEALGADGD